MSFISAVVVLLILGVCVGHACVNLLGMKGCGNVPTAGAIADPSVQYQLQDSQGRHPSGSFAVITCPRIGVTQALMEQGASKGSFGPLLLTCDDGIWSNNATFKCVNVCKRINTAPSQTVIAYSDGAINGIGLEGTTATVSCNESTGIFGTMDMFENGNIVPLIGGSQTYTCDSSGLWTRGGNTAGRIACMRRCVEPPVTNSGDDFDSIINEFTGFLEGQRSVAHGTQLAVRLVHDEADREQFTNIPCPAASATTPQDFAVTIFFTDGTHVGIGENELEAKTALMCVDSHWEVQTITSNHDVNFVNKILSHFACSDD